MSKSLLDVVVPRFRTTVIKDTDGHEFDSSSVQIDPVVSLTASHLDCEQRVVLLGTCLDRLLLIVRQACVSISIEPKLVSSLKPEMDKLVHRLGPRVRWLIHPTRQSQWKHLVALWKLWKLQAQGWILFMDDDDELQVSSYRRALQMATLEKSHAVIGFQHVEETKQIRSDFSGHTIHSNFMNECFNRVHDALETVEPCYEIFADILIHRFISTLDFWCPEQYIVVCPKWNNPRTWKQFLPPIYEKDAKEKDWTRDTWQKRQDRQQAKKDVQSNFASAVSVVSPAFAVVSAETEKFPEEDDEKRQGKGQVSSGSSETTALVVAVLPSSNE